MASNEFRHTPVLLKESLSSLKVKPDGIYVDCTAGGGGHSRAIASLLGSAGRLIAIDRDPQAAEALNERLAPFGNATIIRENFFNVKATLARLGIKAADGILADLGVSSRQLDEPSRGFSFRRDGPLDMRMSMEGTTAAGAIAELSQRELQRIIYEYGEEKFAPSISRAIAAAREKKPIKTTLELAEIIKSAAPASARRDGHPARRTFQALRIYVNGELDGLGSAIDDMFDVLKEGGRLCVITFHSLEDRIVKREFASFAKGCECPKNFPVCVCGKKPRARLFRAIIPSEEEISQNPRSRSARLRSAEKLAEE